MMADITKPDEKIEIDLKEELMKDHEAETEDNDKYMKLAEEADRMYPCRGYGSILRDIAREEEIHRKHIKAIIDDISKWAGDTDGQ